MTDVELPCGVANLKLTVADAEIAAAYPTPSATLTDTQQAIGLWLKTTLASVREAWGRRLPPKPGKQSGSPAFARVMIAVADDSRRVGYDPWIAELADGLVQLGIEENRVEFFVLGQLDDPPLGLRLIRQLGEDTCGRFAVESHRADRESDHDPERDGLDTAFLRSRTLLIAARPIFEAPHWTNSLPTFLGRGLLARPLAEIVQHAACERYLQESGTGASTDSVLLHGLLTLEADGFAGLLAPYLPQVIDAPFRVDHRGEAVCGHVAVTAEPPPPVGAILTATGATPTDLWFDNLLTAATTAARQLRMDGQLWVVGAAEEGLPFTEWHEILTEFQRIARCDSWPAACALARRHAEAAPGLRYAILQLGAVLQIAATVTWISPGLVPEPDDDESERPRREIPAGPRMLARADLSAADLPRPLRILLP